MCRHTKLREDIHVVVFLEYAEELRSVTTHPLAFGVKPEVFGLKLNTNALEPASFLESVGTYHQVPEELLTAGYASMDNLKRLAGKTFAGVQKVGEGKIVYLLDNPHYRMFWRGTSRMVQNAAFLLPGF